MRKLDFNEYKTCQIVARIFEKSIDLSNQSSPIFIRRFLTYDGTKCFFDKTYLYLSCNENDIINEINEKYESDSKNVMYSKEEMYWIGYVYTAICYLYNLNSKAIYKKIPAKEIVKYYRIYHTFDIEEASERMMENIGYENLDYRSWGVKILKDLAKKQKLEN